MDAQNFNEKTAALTGDATITYAQQFDRNYVIRDIRKAAAAFEGYNRVSTGKWGCGIFRGNLYLKFLQQIQAAALAGTSELSFTTYREQKEADNCKQLLDAL